jgi:hypothetical protein
MPAALDGVHLITHEFFILLEFIQKARSFAGGVKQHADINLT